MAEAFGPMNKSPLTDLRGLRAAKIRRRIHLAAHLDISIVSYGGNEKTVEN